jgi:hypothetical protein
MENHQILQKADAEQTITISNSRPVVRFPANPESWFRKRLDHVRNEAKKDIQLKSIRPLHEK